MSDYEKIKYTDVEITVISFDDNISTDGFIITLSGRELLAPEYGEDETEVG